jgi:dipeptidyl aminopeptidase/acylaminoacyl peptidase
MVRTWDAASGKPLGRLEHPGWAHSLAFAADGKTLASMEAGVVRIWDVATSRQLRQLQTLAGSPPVFAAGASPLALSPDGKLLATGPDHYDAVARGANGILQLWDVANGTQPHTLEHPHPTASAAFSPDSKTLAVGTRKGVHLWDAATGKELWKLDLSRGDSVIEALSFSPDGKTLAVGSFDSKIYLLEASSGKELRTLTGHTAWVRALAFSPNGRLLASGSYDQTVRLWEVSAAPASECHQFRGHDSEVTALAFSPDGRRLASGSHDSTALVWDVTGLAERQIQAARLTSGELTACWQSLASTDAARAYQVMRTLAAAPEQTVPFLGGRLREQIRKSPDSQQVARLLAELDSDDFHVRSQATKKLEKLAEAVEPALRQALKNKPSVEARRRIQQLLETMHPEGVSPRLLRWSRVVEVLEWIDNPATRELLRKLAADLPREEVGQEAKNALRRLRAQSRLRPSEQQ